MADPDIAAIRSLLTGRPRPTDARERRERLDDFGRSLGTPERVALQPVGIAGVPAEWSTTPEADATRAVLYLHGGGYMAGSIVSHRHVAVEIGRAAQARTLALGYRRAPEAPYPAQLEDALAAWHYLRDQGITPGRIAVGGDSAGGNLTLALLLALRERKEPLPCCAWLISPWTDLTASGTTMQTKADVDPIIQKPYLLELAQAFCGGRNLGDPLISPRYADLGGLPPLLIQVGSDETLLDDSVTLAGRAGAAGVAVTLQIWPDMIHAFPMFFPKVAAARRATVYAGGYIQRHFATRG
ncbi:MAG TPA: alpha/beta hydrolase [Acetobacteraceae bacterium]|nr:alpha/beta hydrolase [Acetobacteraceae bacterium]